MSDEIFFNGVRFISANEAAEISNLTRDYIARLCRDGRVCGRRVGKNWYVEEQALKEFLVAQEYAKAKRREELTSERAKEYNAANPIDISSRVSVRPRVVEEVAVRGIPVTFKKTISPRASHINDIKPFFASARSEVNVSTRSLLSPRLAIKEKLAHAAVASHAKLVRVSKNIVRAPGTLDSVLHSHAAYAASPVVEFAHKLTALTMALMLTFGTYAFVDPQYARFAQNSILKTGNAITESYTEFMRDGVVVAVSRANAQLAAVARDPNSVLASLYGGVSQFAHALARAVNERVDTFVYNAAFPLTTVESRERAAVVVEISPRRPATTVAIAPDTSKTGTAPRTVISQPVIERIKETERIVTKGGISEEILNAKLEQLDNKLSSKMYSLSSANSTSITNVYNQVAQTQKIDTLGKVTINDSTWNNGTITDASITANDLTVTGGATLRSNITVTGTATFGTAEFTTASSTNTLFTNATSTFLASTYASSSEATSTKHYATAAVTVSATSTNFFSTLAQFTTGIISTLTATIANITNLTATNATTTYATTTNLAAFTSVIAPTFTATSTTATSTFAGGILVNRIPSVPHNFSSWTTGASGSGLFDAALVVNPASATGDSNLISAAVNGSVKFLVDAEGDIFANNLTSVGSVTLSTTSASTFTVEGNTTLGDSITDVTTVNGYLVVTGTTTASTVQGNFGVGTSTPWGRLSVAGTSGGAIPLFVIASSTESYSTSTALLVDLNGFVGIASTTPGSILSINNAANFVQGATSTIYNGLKISGTLDVTSTTATSTFANGLNITNGCLSLSGTCLGTDLNSLKDTVITAGAYGDLLMHNGTNWVDTATSTLFANSSQFALWLSDETGTGNVVFSASPTLTGTATFANLTATEATSTSLFGGSLKSNIASFGQTATSTFGTGGVLTLGSSLTLSSTAGAGTSMLLGTDASRNVVSTSTPTAEAYFATSTTATSTFAGVFSIGSTTPDGAALLSIGTSSPLLTVNKQSGWVGIASTTPGSIFGITNSVNFVQGATSTIYNGLKISGTIDVTSSSATSTFANGLNITNGCLALNGSCLGTDLNSLKDTVITAGAYGDLLMHNGTNWVDTATSTLFANSSQFALWLSDETGTGNVVLSASPTLTGTATFANLTATEATSTSLFGGSLKSNIASFGQTATSSFSGAGVLTLGSSLTLSSTAGAGTSMLLGTDASRNVVSTSTPTAEAYFATSTTATSSFAGPLSLGSTTPDGAALFTIGTSSPIFTVHRDSGRVGIASTTPGSIFGITNAVNFVQGATSTIYNGLKVAGTLDVTSTTATSTFANGIIVTTGGIRNSILTNCNSVDTDANGVFVCGSDATAAGSFAWTPTTENGIILNATTSALSIHGGLFTSTSSIGFANIGAFTATSTTATSTILGPFSIGSTTPDGAALFTIGTSSTLFTVSRDSGRVGIGSTTPGARFAVAGAGYFTGNLQVDGDINTSGCFRVNGVCIGYVKRLAGIFATSTVGTTTVSFGTGGPRFSAGTLTIPATTTEMVVEVWGAGGGGSGAGSGSTAGAVGGDTCFGTNSTACSSPSLSATGGGGAVSGAVSGQGGAGGSGSGGDVNMSGSGGAHGGGTPATEVTYNSGGTGGSAPRGGGGGLGGQYSAAGNAGNTFGGGGGGGGANGYTGNFFAGGGGGGGGYSSELFTSPTGTYYFSINAGGSAGAAGTNGNAGAVGGTGGLVITVYATSSPTAAGNDYAEMFPISNPGINAGDIVAVDLTSPVSMKLAEGADSGRLAGVIATQPGQIIGDINAPGMRPVALMGRVPVKVNLENGPIKIGDRITPSSEPGVGKKATIFDSTVGIAIANFPDDLAGQAGTSPEPTAEGTVMIFVTLDNPPTLQMIGEGLLAKSTVEGAYDFVADLLSTIQSRITSSRSALSISGQSTSTPPTSGLTAIRSFNSIYNPISTYEVDIAGGSSLSDLTAAASSTQEALLDYLAIVPSLADAIRELDERVSFISNAFGTSTAFWIDPEGNVSIGRAPESATSTFAHTLTVEGDVGANAFIVTGWESASSTAFAPSILDTLSSVDIFAIETEHASTTRLSIDVDSAPQGILTTGGIDLYQLGLYNLAGLKELGNEIEEIASTTLALDFRVVEIESVLEALSVESESAVVISPFVATTTALELTEATSSVSTSTPWVASFADASESFKQSIKSLGESVIQVFGKAITAAVGIFEKIFAREVHTDKLCVSDESGETCVTKTQLDALLSVQTYSAGSSIPNDSVQVGSPQVELLLASTTEPAPAPEPASESVSEPLPEPAPEPAPEPSPEESEQQGEETSEPESSEEEPVEEQAPEPEPESTLTPPAEEPQSQ